MRDFIMIQRLRSLLISRLILDQPHAFQTRMSVLADDDVVVHGDAERAGDVDDRFRHLDVGLRRRLVAGGMVVQE